MNKGERDEYIRHYFNCGLHPIPLWPRSKRPKGPQWQKQDLADSSDWQVAKFGDSDNVGLLCGTRVDDGFIVCADLDSGRDDFEKRVQIEDFCVVKSGRESAEGRHYWFVAENLPKSRAFHLNHGGPRVGELQSTGRQCVAPPSIHEKSGKQYELIHGDFDDLPILSDDEIERLFPSKAVEQNEVTYKPLDEGEIKDRAVRNIIAFARERVSSAIPGERHNLINRVAYWLGGFVGSGDLEEEVAKSNLRDCTGLIFDNQEEARAEFKTIDDGIRSGIKRPLHLSRIERADLPEMSDEEWFKFKKRLGLTSKPEPQVVEKVDTIPPIPNHILYPPGPIGDLCKFINETSIRPQPYLSLGASLAFFGMLLGKRVRSPQDTRTNVYCVGVAGTASGKEHARKVLRLLAEESEVGHHIPGEDFTSASAIERVVGKPENESNAMFLLDEWGDIMSGLINTNAPTFKQGIQRTLMKLYSAADGVYAGQEYAEQRVNDQRQQTFKQPCVTIYATTTPESYFGVMKSMHVVNGFLNRYLHFIADPQRPEELEGGILKIPRSLKDEVRRIKALPINQIAGTGSHNPDLIEPMILKYSDKASLIRQEFRDLCDQKIDGDDQFKDLWGRSSQFVVQVALILSATQNKSEIEYEDMLLAVEIVELCIKRTIHSVKLQLADNEQEHITKKVYRTIEDAGRKGMLKSTLCKKTYYLKAYERKDIIQTLEDSGQILIEEVKTSKKISLRYVASAHA